MAELWQKVGAALIVIGAIVYLVGHFTGFFERIRRRGRPDVPASKLVRRKKPDAKKPDRP